MKRRRRRSPRSEAAHIGRLHPTNIRVFNAVTLGLGVYFGLKYLGVVK